MGRLKVDVVFEAASHRRFAHEAWIVLEWPNDPECSFPDMGFRALQIMRECSRFEVGLMTMSLMSDGTWNIQERIEAVPHEPAMSGVEDWLDYSFERDKEAREFHEARIREINRRAVQNAINSPTHGNK